MDITKHSHAANRSYEDFDPLFVWRREEGRDTLELHLPGFKRDQIRIQINHAGFLVISGERPWDSGNHRWKRFRKEFKIPSYCNEDAIHGNMMQSILSVVMPKKSPLMNDEEEQQHKKEKRANIKEQETETRSKDALAGEDRREYNEYEEREVRLPQDTTKEVALKFMLVMVLILVIASYLADISKGFMAEAQSYFHN